MPPVHKRGFSAYSDFGLDPRSIIKFWEAPDSYDWKDIINHVTQCIHLEESEEINRILGITIKGHAKYALGFTKDEIKACRDKVVEAITILSSDLYELEDSEMFYEIEKLILSEGPSRSHKNPKKEKEVQECMACN